MKKVRNPERRKGRKVLTSHDSYAENPAVHKHAPDWWESNDMLASCSDGRKKSCVQMEGVNITTKGVVMSLSKGSSLTLPEKTP